MVYKDPDIRKLILTAFAQRETDRYSRLSNKSTGTMEKKHPKIGAVRNFFCGTFEVNTKFLVAVLLFHYPYSTAKAPLEVLRSQLPEFLAPWSPPKIALLSILCRSLKLTAFLAK